MNRSTRLILAGLPLALLIAGVVQCGGDDDDDTGDDDDLSATPGTTETPSPTPTPAALTWNTGISTIFAERCLTCHTWAGAYDTVVPRIQNGTLEPKVTSGHNISGTQRDLVLAWIAAGYPEDVNSPTPTPTPTSSPTPGGTETPAESPTPGETPTPPLVTPTPPLITPTPPPVTPTPTVPPTPRPLSWDGGIDDIFQARCSSCHSWATNYNYVVARIENGTLEPQIQKGHHISGSEKTEVLNWIDSGYPKR